MKRILFVTLTLATFLATAQSTTTFRRIKTTTSTVPASDTIAGKVWTDSSNTTYKVLRYVGGVKMDSLWKSGNIGKNGYYWIYVPTNSVPLARVISVSQTGVDTFSITVDRAMTGVVNKAIKSINGKVYAYVIQNDGDTTGTVNGVIVKPDTQLTFPYLWVQGTGTLWQEPIEVNATLTDFLIIEKH